ncbi:hypothetical protein [Pontibacter sp. G13]|uniref:hypothetical protein n=1 Tax=Pontibacter sp. G13 TaxID=3074898 RepID=UPI002889C141|nr:hypothetical protein [Pontibacter sp. G13]WNJ16456.1 hypothetical protein RJD25_16445 [Pontibacter sp. G13]
MIRTFSIKTLLFLLPIMAALGVLEYVQRVLPNNYTHKRQLFEAGLDQWENWILGSSHSYLGIQPDLLDGRSFNMGATAQTLYFDHFLLHKYIDQLPNLRRVIVPVSYPTFGSESDRNIGDYDKSYEYAHFYGSEGFVSNWSPKRYSLVNLFTIKKSVDRSIAYYQGKDSLVEFRRNGWYWTEEQRDLEKNGQNAGTFHDQFYDETLIPLNVNRIVEMAETCDQHGVELVLVSMPMHQSYLSTVNPARYQRMQELADSLSQALPIAYYNFTEDPRFTDEDFFDSNHLRSQGAIKFTQIFRATLEHGEMNGSSQPLTEAKWRDHPTIETLSTPCSPESSAFGVASSLRDRSFAASSQFN